MNIWRIIGNRSSCISGSEWSEKWIKRFIYSVGVVLLITGVAKLVSAGGKAALLERLDPIFGIPFRSLFAVAGLCEVIVGVFCLFGDRLGARAALVAWLGTSFIFYRCSLLWIGYQKPCPCLGSLTDALHISTPVADMVIKWLLAYLVVGSYATLLWLWFKKHQASFCQ